MHFTYSRWDGTQASESLDPEVLIEALADEVLESGDVDAALARLIWHGIDNDADEAFPGGRSLVDAFVRERERFRHAQRSESGSKQPDAFGAGEHLRSTAADDSVADLEDESPAIGELDGEPLLPPAADPALQDRNNSDGRLDAGLPRRHKSDGGPRSVSLGHDVSRQRPGAGLTGTATLSGLDARPATITPSDREVSAPPVEGNGHSGTGASDLDLLERELLQACRAGNLDALDAVLLERVLGRGAREFLARLHAIPDALIRARYLRRTADQLELTGRGVRRVGQKALDDIFRGLRSQVPGDHPVPGSAVSGSIADGHKPFDAEDDFLLDLNRTLLNAVARIGPVRPIALSVEDFEVVRTDRLTQAYTVLALDVSPSMALRGCLAAGRRVALALNALIQKRFPRDRLYLVVFSGYARPARVDTLQRLRPDEREYGTNMQHGLAVARRLLARHRGSRQIVLITDGEPTAHLEGERAHFAYPPTVRTRNETLREVRRCTRDDIVINTFMLDSSQDLAEFVDEITRINRGRSFFTTPDRLGEYVITDYVGGRVQR